MSEQINHRNLEQAIGKNCRCDDYLQLKVAGFYSTNNKVAVASRQGEDHFRLSARGPKSDLSQAVALDSRYLVIGNIKDIDKRIFDACVLNGEADMWLEIPDNLYISRLLIAGAIRVVVIVDALPKTLAQTSEYRQAILDRRVIEVIC